MGYTVYWNRPKKIEKDIMEKVGQHFKKLLKKDVFYNEYGIEIGNGTGQGEPVIEDDIIVFNGKPGCESFAFYQDISEKSFVQEIEPGKYFSFCKTRRLPYDLVVKTVLLIFKYYMKDDLELSCDGPNENNTSKALDIVEKELSLKLPKTTTKQITQ